MNRQFRWLALIVLAISIVGGALATPFATSAQIDAEQAKDLATAYECAAEIGAVSRLGPQAILVAMATPACVETLWNGLVIQGDALVRCVMQYPAEVCLGLEAY